MYKIIGRGGKGEIIENLLLNLFPIFKIKGLEVACSIFLRS